MYGRNSYLGDEVSFEVIHKSSKRGAEKRFMDERERRVSYFVALSFFVKFPDIFLHIARAMLCRFLSRLIRLVVWHFV